MCNLINYWVLHWVEFVRDNYRYNLIFVPLFEYQSLNHGYDDVENN